MIKLLLALLAVGQAAAVQPTVVSSSEISRYEAVRASAPIAIDGVISEKEWGKAEKITQFSDLFHPERPMMHPTVARMMWDDKYFYVAFECTDDDIWATMTRRDDFLWMEQAVEVYIDPEGNGRHYYEIEVNPLNAVYDLIIPRGGWEASAAMNSRYDIEGLLTAVKVYGTLDDRNDRDEKWTVEMAIPWRDFRGRKVNLPPKDGDTWRVQLFRIERPGVYPAEEQIVSWSKSPGVFHEPRNFGVVTFQR